MESSQRSICSDFLKKSICLITSWISFDEPSLLLLTAQIFSGDCKFYMQPRHMIGRPMYSKDVYIYFHFLKYYVFFFF